MASSDGLLLIYQGRTGPASPCTYMIKSLVAAGEPECVMRPTITLENKQTRGTAGLSLKGILGAIPIYDILVVDGTDLLIVPLTGDYVQGLDGRSCFVTQALQQSFLRMAFVRSNPRP